MEKPSDLTAHETWQWSEAAFCDQMAKELRGYIPGWLERGDKTHPTNFTGAYECAVRAECWEQVARHLRQSYYGRKEQEAYDALFRPTEPAVNTPAGAGNSPVGEDGLS